MLREIKLGKRSKIKIKMKNYQIRSGRVFDTKCLLMTDCSKVAAFFSLFLLSAAAIGSSSIISSSGSIGLKVELKR